MAAIRLQYDLKYNLGSSATPLSIAAAGNMMNMYTVANHTSGDVRNIYNQLYLDGTAGGESLRACTTVRNNIANAESVHAIHASLKFSAVAGGSECAGLGTPIRGTLHIPDIASWSPAGTLYAGMFEIYSDGTASDPAGLTCLGGLCVANSGGTGKADVDTDAVLFDFPGWTAASGITNAVSSTKLAELTAVTNIGLRIKVGGTNYRLIAVLESEWN